MRLSILLALCSLIAGQTSTAQDLRWQQRVEYTMSVKLDVNTHKLKGTQKLTYFNNSPDTLRKVYYHLFFNAFQPGSMMDVRSRTIVDPDSRVGDRIASLKDHEIGYQHINVLKQDGKDVSYLINGTIMEVTLPRQILPNSKSVFDMEFEAQVPVQIRRSGRNNKEGIDYSMTQWYPKMVEYDFRGWHPYQYVAREFHGVWGDFDVRITIDPRYTVGGTGVLQNADKVGHGYEKPGTQVKKADGEITWHFVARNVHDFAWAADPDYAHDKVEVPDGPELHFFYQPGEETTDNWKRLQPAAVAVFEFLNNTFGRYPYETYSVIQGGDGGMEYPMCTLVTGERTVGSLIGTSTHEIAHSWYQGVVANNEAMHPWMDEGFADFAANEAMEELFRRGHPHARSYDGYFRALERGTAEAASQHSDHFTTNGAYSNAAYRMGTVFLHQLKYIIGNEAFYRGMRRYYNTWKFRHPEPNDFIRVMEKVSGLQLKWYLSYWINTLKTINYGIKNIVPEGDATLITLHRLGEFPMPVDFMVTYQDGSQELYYIPLNETLGNKPVEDQSIQRVDLEAWPWVNPEYTLKINRPASEISTVEIDATMRMADIDRSDNKVDIQAVAPYEDPTR